MIERVNLYQLDLMKHAIGFERRKVKRGKYVAWRNYFTSEDPCYEWENLLEHGLAIKDMRKGMRYYFVTDKGL